MVTTTFRLPLLSDDGDDAVDLGDDRLALGLASLEELFDPGQTCRDVIDARHASRVEGAHGQLGAGLADGLGGDDPHCLAHLDQSARVARSRP